MSRDTITVFLCGDLMAGRGVDQVLTHPSAVELHEPVRRDARDYVDLAERINGPIPRRVEPQYIWGDALRELDRVRPDARIVNLETTLTRSDAYARQRLVHYRMHPANVDCLTIARIDVCALANNHVLDYGYAGLTETLSTLHDAGIKTTGAGQDRTEAEQPAIIDVSRDHRVIVFSLGCESSGVPELWSALPDRPGVDYLPDLWNGAADSLLHRVALVRRRGDIVIASIHWGSNWGYDVPGSYARFARRLLNGGVALVHGHSSHHPRPIEIYNRGLILYGCGDFITDYEGIRSRRNYRSDLALMYFATVDAGTGELMELRMTPMRIRRFQATFASRDESAWLHDAVARHSERFGASIELLTNDATGLAEFALRPNA